MSFQSARQSLIAQRGRPMSLSRRTGSVAGGGITAASLPVYGFLAMYKPQEMTGNVRQGDAQVSITNTEIAAAGWDFPRPRDQMVIDGNTWSVQGSSPLYDGPLCVGHTIWVRGGAG